jgi:mannose-6-phosphate isomerase-like protein (cupin superfamily)
MAVLIFAELASPAGDPPGFLFWKSTELKMQSKTLRPKMNEMKIATQSLGAHGNYSFLLAHREGSGEAELHEKQADIFFVQTGEATLVYGGEMEGGKATAPNEMRAPSIKGGTEKKLAPGDVVTIPVKVPHQVRLDPGKEFTYFVVKVNQ